MFALFRWLMDRAIQVVRVRAHGSNTFVNRKGRPSRFGSSTNRLSDLVRGATVLDVVESSGLIRAIETLNAGVPGTPWVEWFQLRAAGGLGVIRIPCGSECALKEDLLGSSLDVVGADGSAFKAYCWSTAGYAEDVAVGFVFTPTPSSTTASLRISLQPFAAAQGPSRTVTLEVALVG